MSRYMLHAVTLIKYKAMRQRDMQCNIHYLIILRGLSPRANYTDRATAIYQRSSCQFLRIEGCHMVSVADPHGHIPGFLDRSRFFFFQVAPQLYSRG
jgi:hypothetical protein